MQAFVVGFCVSAGWVVFILPVLIVKSAFRMTLD